MITIDVLNKMNKYELQELFNLYLNQLETAYLPPLDTEDGEMMDGLLNMLSSIFDVANNKIVVENKMNEDMQREITKIMRDANR